MTIDVKELAKLEAPKDEDLPTLHRVYVLLEQAQLHPSVPLSFQQLGIDGKIMKQMLGQVWGKLYATASLQAKDGLGAPEAAGAHSPGSAEAGGHVREADSLNPSPACRAMAMSVLALSHDALGKSAEAEDVLEQASDLLNKLLGNGQLSHVDSAPDTLIAKILFDEAVSRHESPAETKE